MMELTYSGDKAAPFAERCDHHIRVSCTILAQAAYEAIVEQSRKDLAVESGGKAAFESCHGRSADIKASSSRANRPQ